MIEQSMDGLLFFRGARVLYTCVATNVTQTGARILSDKLGPVPIDFYVTFDTFRTIAKCRLVWRYQNRIGVTFERWVQVRGRSAGSDSEPR
jgi:3-deoxy-D-manno-octulosonic-acid transferase